MKLVAIIILLVLYLSCNGQKDKNEGLSKDISKYADSAGNALVRKDYRSFVRFMYPKVVDETGGEAATIKLIQKLFKDEIESQGGELISATFGNPSSAIKVNNELQATVPQTLIAKFRDGKLIIKGTLIAISMDNGKTWKFMDTSGKDIATMKSSYPNLSDKLVLPPLEDPIFTKE
jgi:hypothetical protein